MVKKSDRQYDVLIGCVEQYLKTGKPVGSQVLQNSGFDHISSATIRNYFAELEKEGLLAQQHASGGRIPTHKALRTYVAHIYDETDGQKIAPFEKEDTEEIAAFLQLAAETLSEQSSAAVFISAPRFDHDFIVDIKLVPIDAARAVAILVSNFGVIHTETLALNDKLSLHRAKAIETYFKERLTGIESATALGEDDSELANHFYNELLIRYIVGYANFTDPDLYRTGFSRLLAFPEFQDTAQLASCLSLFENAHSMRLLLRECSSLERLKVWIGSDLDTYTAKTPECAVIAIPYCINGRPVGAIGLLGPARMPYKEQLPLIRSYAAEISDVLTRNIYKYKISYREPAATLVESKERANKLLVHKNPVLIEDRRS